MDEAQDLISAYLQGMRDKLDHPDTTLADLAMAFGELFDCYLMLQGEPVSRREVTLRVEGLDGKDAQVYQKVIEETVRDLLA